MAPLAPERGDRLTDRGVAARRVGVHEARVGEFATCRRIDAVNFGVGEGFEILAWPVSGLWRG